MKARGREGVFFDLPVLRSDRLGSIFEQPVSTQILRRILVDARKHRPQGRDTRTNGHVFLSWGQQFLKRGKRGRKQGRKLEGMQAREGRSKIDENDGQAQIYF